MAFPPESDRRFNSRLSLPEIASEVEVPFLRELTAAAEVYVSSLSMNQILEIKERIVDRVAQGEPVESIEDFAKRKSLEMAILKRSVVVDDMTGLFLYKGIAKRLVSDLQDIAKTFGKKLMVLQMDTDNLGRVNKEEEGGVDAGDKFIIAAKEIALEESKKVNALMYRRAEKDARSDEFYMFAIVDDWEQALEFAKGLGNRLYEELADRAELSVVRPASASFGIVVIDADEDLDDARSIAGGMQQLAKEKGKKRLRLLDSHSDSSKQVVFGGELAETNHKLSFVSYALLRWKRIRRLMKRIASGHI